MSTRPLGLWGGAVVVMGKQIGRHGRVMETTYSPHLKVYRWLADSYSSSQATTQQCTKSNEPRLRRQACEGVGCRVYEVVVVDSQKRLTRRFHELEVVSQQYQKVEKSEKCLCSRAGAF